MYAQLASQAMAQAVQYEQEVKSTIKLIGPTEIVEEAKIKDTVDGNKVAGIIGGQNKVHAMQATAFIGDMAHKLYSSNVASFNVDMSKNQNVPRTSQAKNTDVDIGRDHDAVKSIITDMQNKLDS